MGSSQLDGNVRGANRGMLWSWEERPRPPSSPVLNGGSVGTQFLRLLKWLRAQRRERKALPYVQEESLLLTSPEKTE